MKNKSVIFWFLFVFLIAIRVFFNRSIYKNGDNIRITSTVLSDPVTYTTYQSVNLNGLKVYLPTFPEIDYGDRIVVEGIVDSNKLTKAKLISIRPHSSFGSGIREKLITFYQKNLPQPMSGLIAGITLGSKGALSTDFYELTKITGVAHVVVASGTNITFVISFIFGLTALFLPRKKSIPIVLLSIVLYLFLSGFEAPLIRAAVMAFSVFLAESSGRMVDSWRNLVLTAGLMLLIEPSWIRDLGFILSFASTTSIMVFYKKISLWLKKAPRIIKEDFSTTLAAQIGVAPILFVTFGQFNPFSPIINVLVLWTVPLIMILGSLGGVLGLVLPFMGRLVLYLCYPLAWWFVRVVTIFS